MRKLVLAATVIASIVGSQAAMAAADVTGTIKALDAKACTVTLDSKAVYHFGAKCDFSKLTVGEKVTITGTEAAATAIVAAK